MTSIIKNNYLYSICFLFCLFSSDLSAVNSVNEYRYDSRGRLTQAKNDLGKEINYTYDDAGNRISVNDGAVVPPPPPSAPVITSFSAPRKVTVSGATALISWSSTGATYCALAIFGSSSSYPNMPTTSSVSIRIYSDTPITITCFNGAQSAFASKTIRLITLN